MTSYFRTIHKCLCLNAPTFLLLRNNFYLHVKKWNLANGKYWVYLIFDMSPIPINPAQKKGWAFGCVFLSMKFNLAPRKAASFD